VLEGGEGRYVIQLVAYLGYWLGTTGSQLDGLRQHGQCEDIHLDGSQQCKQFGKDRLNLSFGNHSK